MHQLHLILFNIRSAYNVGAILRTADAAGVSKVYLCGYTPSPIDRFGRKRKDVAKSALGAEETVSWEHCDDVVVCIKKLKSEGVRVVAVEQHKDSVPYNTLTLDQPTALVVGEEVAGITDEVLGECDAIAEIPMYGKKESLNVSVATGVVCFVLRREF